MAPEPAISHISRIVASAGIKSSDVTQAVITDSVEMPNMQVRFDLEDSGWMFGNLEVAPSSLQTQAPYDRSESGTTNTMH